MDKPKVLYIDDEIENLQSFRFLFKKEFDITISQSPLEGLEILKEEEFSIILSDSRMPVMNGIEFLSHAKDLQPNACRILVTGYSDYESILMAINQAGISKCVQKPYEKEEMLGYLFSCVEKATFQTMTLSMDFFRNSFIFLFLNEEKEIRFLNENLNNLMNELGVNIIGKTFQDYFYPNLKKEKEKGSNSIYSFANSGIDFYFVSEKIENHSLNRTIFYGYYEK